MAQISQPEPGVLVIPLSNKPPIKIREAEWPILVEREFPFSSTHSFTVTVRQRRILYEEQRLEHLAISVGSIVGEPGDVHTAYYTDSRKKEDYLEAITRVCERLNKDPLDVLSLLPAEDHTRTPRGWAWSTREGDVHVVVKRADLPEGFEEGLKEAFPEIENYRKPIDRSALARVAED